MTGDVGELDMDKSLKSVGVWRWGASLDVRGAEVLGQGAAFGGWVDIEEERL